jgi:hypothetical protein
MTSEKQIAVQNVSPEKIQSRILVIRGAQVMLDRDLAELYGVSVKRLNEQVSRNIERFPSGFMFQLSVSEFADLKSQIATSSLDGKLAHLKSQFATSSWGGIRKAPKVFTEQGVAMLSAVLNSPTAILVSIAIMEAFVRMRHFMMDNAEVVCRMNVLEKKQMSTDAKVDDILKRLDSTERPSQGVFYDGQLWDARALVLKLIGSAKRSLILIDNWATTETLDLFTKKRRGVKLTIFTSEHYDKKHVPHRKISDADIATFNAQYPHLAVRYNETFHDRFLIVDDKDLYLIGASLKDLGKKCFGFTKMDAGEIDRLKKVAFGTAQDN